MSQTQQLNNIIVNIKDVKQVKYIVSFSKDVAFTMAKDFINLQYGKIYYVPINNKTIKLKDYTFFKINPELIDSIDVRNIEDGLATVIPLMHNVQLKHNTELGVLI